MTVELDVSLHLHLHLHQGVDLGRASLLMVDLDDADLRIRSGGHAVPIIAGT